MQLLNKKYRKAVSAMAKLFIMIYIFALAFLGSAAYLIPEKICVTQDELLEMNKDSDVSQIPSYVDARLFGKIPLKTVELEVIEQNRLIPCGNVFGVKFFTKGVMVIRLSEVESSDGSVSPSKEAGLKEGDVIQSINGMRVNTAEEMADAVEKSKGEGMEIVYVRNANEYITVLTPVLSLSDRKYKTGIWVRDSTAGIGTMTCYNPSTGEFAGLGHGICDVDTGLLMPLLSASVVDVEITDIIKGRRGTPGELKGDFDSIRKGKLMNNTESGVYGIMDKCPDGVENEPCEIGLADEIYEGKAYILCELDENGVEEYEINITKIRSDNTEGKNFVIEVTDSKLIEKTGGIVQGMSGSPVIQNGKLVGAVTHVLVNSPSKGYGIFIQNMLKG